MSMPLRVTEVDFGPTFARLDKPEQVFLVQLTRLLNEVNILTKAVLYTDPGGPETPAPVRTAQRVTGLFFLRQLAGKLWEGWRMLEHSYFGAKLSKRYDQHLGPEAREALEQMRRYFEQKNNPLELVRNKHESHYDRCVIEGELAQVPQGEPLLAFISENAGNCLFVFAEDIATRSVLQGFGGDDQSGMDKLCRQIAIEVPSWFQDFGAEILRVMLQTGEVPTAEREIPDVPGGSDVHFPFFVRGGER